MGDCMDLKEIYGNKDFVRLLDILQSSRAIDILLVLMANSPLNLRDLQEKLRELGRPYTWVTVRTRLSELEGLKLIEIKSEGLRRMLISITERGKRVAEKKLEVLREFSAT